MANPTIALSVTNGGSGTTGLGGIVGSCVLSANVNKTLTNTTANALHVTMPSHAVSVVRNMSPKSPGFKATTLNLQDVVSSIIE